MLATTATANRRVEADVGDQLGGGVLVQRGPAGREPGIAGDAVAQSRRAAGADGRPDSSASGSGIVFTLTTRDADRGCPVAAENVKAHAYHAGKTDDERQASKRRCWGTRSSAWSRPRGAGHGVTTNPNLGFVIHYQTPGSVVFYYQQVGRAGRAIDEEPSACCPATRRRHQCYFRDTAFPPGGRSSGY